MTERFRLIGEATTPEEIIDAFNTRRKELSLSLNELDFALGFAPRYAHKLLAKNYNKNFGRQSLPCMLQALGLKLAIVEDREARLPSAIRAAIATKILSPSSAERVERHARVA